MRGKFGFTLVEILVVLVIISTTVTFAILSFGDFGKSRQAKAAAEQLAQYITLLQQKAILENRLLGLSLKPHSYQAMRYNGLAGWQYINKGNLYREQPLPGGLQFHFPQKTVNANIDIAIQTTGDITPFTISIANKNKQTFIQVIGKANGELSIHEPS